MPQSWSPQRQLRSRIARAVPVGIAVAVLAGVFAMTPAAERVEQETTVPLLFKARAALAMDPKLDPRMKIFAYGDSTVSELGLPSQLPIADWVAMIEALKTRQPRAILVDFVWSMPATEADEQLLRAMGAGPVPVVTGAYASDSEVSWWKRMPAGAPALLPAGEVEPGDGQNLYGPLAAIAETSSYIGHLNLRMPGAFRPFVRGHDGTRLPALALRVPSSAPLPPTGADGWAQINWIDPAGYRDRIARVADLWTMVRDKRPIATVNEGDVVLILSGLYTPSGVQGDARGDTYIGPLAPGYGHAAIAQGALTGDWLRRIDPGPFGPIAGAAVAVALVCAFDSGVAAAALVLAELLLAALALALFAGRGEILYALPSAIALGASGLALLAQRQRHEAVLLAQIDQALSGVIAPKVLDRIRKDPGSFRVVASDQMLTALFVDFVGFSAIAEQLEPEAMFNALEEVLAALASIVHAHGGVVDKTVGDGIIAFFGYEPVTGGVDPEHADHALHCAVAIQRHLAAFACARKGTGLPTFPARIGLNSGRAHVGNLGGGRRFDVTIIGHTVNMAKRFEDACETFRVLLGPNTFGLLSEQTKAQGFEVRKAKIKHRKSYLDAYECDPFAGNGTVLREALDAHRQFAGLERGTERHILPAGTHAYVVIEGARRAGEIVDFSATGLQLRLDEVYFANRVRIGFTLEVEHAGGRIQRIDGCQAIVKWGRKSQDGYRHGVELEEPTPDLRRLLRDFAEAIEAA